MASRVSIYSIGFECQNQLRALISANPFRSDPLRKGQQATWPDELLARFEYLASDFELFGLGSSAIDHRLRENDNVHAMVVQYLQAIQANVEIGASAFSQDKHNKTNSCSVPKLRGYPTTAIDGRARGPQYVLKPTRQDCRRTKARFFTGRESEDTCTH
jgi:hypothetical protein